MKKYLRVLSLLLIIIVAGKSAAYEACVDGIYYDFYEEGGNKAMVTYGDDYYSGDVDIPLYVKYNGQRYSVAYIGANAFNGCINLTRVFIPSGVISIGYHAFYGCSGLTSINVSNANYYYHSQDNCNAIVERKTNKLIVGCQTTVIPESVTCIAESAFYGCIGLTSITIPYSVNSIESDAFNGCTGLASVTINCSNVGSWFSGLSSIKNVTLGENVTNVKSGSFNGCTGLASVTINCSNVDSWFSGLSSIKNVTLGENVTNIKSGSFNGCTGLTSVTINCSNVDSWFSGLSSIKNVTLGENVTSIGDSAFKSCKGLTTLSIGSGVTTIGNYTFANCSQLKEVFCHAINVPNTKKTFYNSSIASAILHVPTVSVNLYKSTSPWSGFATVIPIGDIIFADANVKALCLANWDTNNDGELNDTEAARVTSLGDVFRGKANITSFKELQYFIGLSCIDNYAFQKCTSLSSVVIPYGVTSIGYNVFDGCISLSSVAIPNGVTSIGNYTFRDCCSLTFVTIPESVTDIGYCAFSGCSGLSSVTIPNGVTNIGGYTFYQCNSLTSVIIPESVTDIGYCAFSGCSGLSSVTIPNGVKNIGDYTFYGCSSLTSVIIPESVTNIGYCAFCNCTSLGSISIPNRVTSIGSNAFSDCNNLTSVSIGSRVTNIGDYAFANCSQLRDVICYAESVPHAGGNTFFDSYYSPIASATLHVPTGSVNLYKSTSPWSGFGSIIPLGGEIEEDDYIDGIYYNFTDNEAEVINGDIIYSGKVVIPSSVFYKGKTYPVTSIGENAFSGCTGLTSVTIPNSVTAIGLEAFRGCSGLTSITIPASVTYVGDNAFKGCTSLKNVSMETNKPNKHFTRNNSDERWHDHVAISGTQGVNDSEDYTMLLDNDINTKWCVAHVDGTIYIEFDATCPIKPTEYMLTTGNDTQSNPGRNPKSWIIKGRNSTSDDWTTLTTVDDGNMPSESFVSKTFSLNTNTAYRYYRFEVTSLVSGTIFQLSEFCFLINDTSDNKRWLNYIATAGTPGFDTSENYPKLLDNDISTKWCTEYINGSIFIEFDATSSITPIGYELTTGDETYWEPGRNPKSWIIKGRNETSDEWTTLTTVDDGNMPSESYASKTFSLNTNTSYRYYRFEVTSLVSGTIFQLSEFCFLVSDNNDEPIDDDTDVLVLGSNGSSPLFADCPLDSVFIGRNISYSTSSDKGYSPFYCNTPLRSVNISGAAKEVFSKEFYGCTNLKNVQIGGKMLTIGDYAFYGCTGLKEFYCEAEQTPAVTSSSFKNVDVSAVMLVVPDNSVELYKAHPIWKLFWVETPTGIKETNSLTSGLSKGEGDWYDLQGRKLAEPQKGINIIRYCDGTTRKVMIR